MKQFFQRKWLLALFICFSALAGRSQALEDVIVEEYYVSDANDAMAVFGIPGPEVGSTTYRVFIDMAPSFQLQQITGFATNALEIATTTGFYNPTGASVSFGENLGGFLFNAGAVPLDSYLSLGFASTGRAGIPKALDTDGSVFVGRLQNTAQPINVVDGAVAPNGEQVTVQTLGAVNLNIVNVQGANSFFDNNNSIFNLNGAKGATSDNIVMLGQFTTTGEFSFKLNFLIYDNTTSPGPAGTVVEYYNHTNVVDNGGNLSVVSPLLTWPRAAASAGCTTASACNFDATAAEDDGSCIVPVENCSTCNASNDALVLIDTDNDGTCNAEDGCPNDANKTNPGLCGCGTTDDDTNGNGVADCQDVPGCTDPTAENFNPSANLDDASCTFDNGGGGDGISCDGLPGALEDVIVEEYYVSNALDAMAVFGIPGPEVGSTTYRIFVDMAPSFQLQQITGFATNPLEVATTTGFYNPTGASVSFGENLGGFLFNAGAVPLDSYFSLGFASTGRAGITKALDTDGSVFTNRLQNTVNPINVVDGSVVPNGEQVTVQILGAVNLDIVNVQGASTFFDNNNSIFNLDGAKGATSANQVMIGQFTTTGEFSFKLNLLIYDNTTAPGPSGTVVEYYTHTNVVDNGGNLSRICPALTFPPVSNITGCTDIAACNFNAAASIDDGSCLVPIPNCEACNATNDGFVIIDSDGDGVCDAQEIAGCTSATACNFNGNATDDNGTCIEPIDNCQACNTANDGLVLVDTDGDGVCNAEEIAGCTSASACNFNGNATDNNGTCIEPVANCQACNAANDGLVIVDIDGDGICDADEVAGCTSTTACNFDTDATDDNGTCIEPIDNCQACNAANDSLVIVDTDGDGICNADEVAGCTSTTACNFDTDATDDNGTCIEPIENCQACNAANDGLVIVDMDGDGVCDADEVAGCTSATACNFSGSATDDNGSCIEPIANCQECNATNDGLNLIDTDGDGVCNSQDACPTQGAVNNGDACTTAGGLAGVITDCVCVTDVVLGCTSATACNFNAGANQNDGSCVEPVANCAACNAANGGLVIIDTDGDGVCDADEIAGCQDETACNFNPDATDTAPETCVEPIENCFVCNDEGGLTLVDTDGDGICDVQEIAGCTSSTACNFEASATDDNGSCIEPIANCIACGDNGEGILIDSDGDGICNALEAAGCQDMMACNFNPDATDSDPASCVEAEAGCTVCNSDGGVDLIDADGDGICNADEVAGCTNMMACNFNADATDDNGTCVLNGTACELEAGGTGTLVDCECVADAVPGCKIRLLVILTSWQQSTMDRVSLTTMLAQPPTVVPE